MMEPLSLWPVVTGAAVVVFGAGAVVERIRNNKYVQKDMCFEKHSRESDRWDRIERSITRIELWIDKQEKS